MIQNKNIFDFYQSSGVYDRVIFNKKISNNCLTLNDLKKKINNLKDFYNKKQDQIVFSDGNSKSKIMIIGDAPGTSDEINGKPFSGESGELLDKMLLAINLNRNKVYLTNIINFRLQDNKKLGSFEIKNYRSIILDHIKIINPKIIFILGSVTFNFFFENTQSLTKLRGHWNKIKIGNSEYDCLPSYHPAFLLRQPSQKKVSVGRFKKTQNKKLSNKICVKHLRRKKNI